MKSAWTLFAILILMMSFEFFPNVQKMEGNEWNDYPLSKEDSIASYEMKRKVLYLESTGYYWRPFIFNREIVVPKHTHIYNISWHIIFLVLLTRWVTSAKIREYPYMYSFFILSFGYMLDYLLTYNKVYAVVGDVGLSYDLGWAITYGVFLIIQYVKDNWNGGDGINSALHR